MTSLLYSTAYQKINFIFNGEEMTTIEAFIKLQDDFFRSLNAYLNVFLPLSLGGYWACVGS